jgi:hypothetical protein
MANDEVMSNKFESERVIDYEWPKKVINFTL